MFSCGIINSSVLVLDPLMTDKEGVAATVILPMESIKFIFIFLRNWFTELPFAVLSRF